MSSRARSVLRRGALRVLAVLSVSSAAIALSCDGDMVTLGHQPTPAERLDSLNTSFDEENPSLTLDLLEIYFISDREDGVGDSDIWFSRRVGAELPFDEPQQLSDINSDEFESSPAISADGLTLWFGSDRDGGAGGVDIWVTRRASRDDAWGEPENVTELNTESDEIPRPLGDGETTMPLSSRRGPEGLYWTYLAKRSAPDQPFSEPVLIESLAKSDTVVVDAWLSDDGQELWFKRSQGGDGDIHIARRTAGGDFVDQGPTTLLNTGAEERDPWLSVDGSHIFFASDRDGDLAIYELERTP